MENNKVKVYFASPFFNDDQIEREERCKAKLRELGFKVWSPKENCIVTNNFSSEARTKAFQDNIKNIDNADIIFAITDGKDMGTIWEAGYAYAKDKLIIYYCETLGDNKFNLMLAESGTIILLSFDEMDQLPELIETGGHTRYVGAIE